MMPELRPEAVSLVEKVKTFIKDEITPKEHVFHEQIQEGKDRLIQAEARVKTLINESDSKSKAEK